MYGCACLRASCADALLLSVRPAYAVCIACMDTWSSCAPLTSNYGTTHDPNNLHIRDACDAKKPISVADAAAANITGGNVASATSGPFVVPGDTAVTLGGRRMLHL